MIDPSVRPKNAEHFARLISFAREILAACDQIGLTPVLNGSLAVLAYTGDPSIEVHDIDLSCSEARFPQVQQALESMGIECRVKSWRVLQAFRGDLKIEFDSAEHWMHGIPERHEMMRVGDVQFCMVGVDGLRELYRRGLVDTAGQEDDSSRRKHRAIKEKLLLLDSRETRPPLPPAL